MDFDLHNTLEAFLKLYHIIQRQIKHFYQSLYEREQQEISYHLDP